MKNYKIFMVGLSCAVAVILLKNIPMAWVKFWLMPIVGGVSLMNGANFKFVSARGYVEPSLGVVVNKECAGFYFFFILFGLLMYTLRKRNKKKTFVKVGVIAIGSYGITVISNISRIFLSMQLLQFKCSMVQHYFGLLHELIGIICYSVFFVIGYLVLRKYIQGEKCVCKN